MRKFHIQDKQRSIKTFIIRSTASETVSNFVNCQENITPIRMRSLHFDFSNYSVDLRDAFHSRYKSLWTSGCSCNTLHGQRILQFNTTVFGRIGCRYISWRCPSSSSSTCKYFPKCSKLLFVLMSSTLGYDDILRRCR